MNEDLLQHIWKIGAPIQKPLYTVSGQPIEVIKRGYLNTLSGPDFLEATIKIDNTIWAGNVEIHFKTSNWNQHNHQNDKAYNNIILHVVWIHDKDIFTENNITPPILELSKFVSEEVLISYQNLISGTKLLPCSGYIGSIDEGKLRIWLSKMAYERLTNKSNNFIKILDNCNQNWEEAFVRFYIAAMGFSSNKEAFEVLANQLNYNHLLKIRNQPNAIEAYLFGLCGLLDKNFTEEFPQKLCKEWVFLKQKYQFKEILRAQLKFGGVRPANYPTIRLAQIAEVLKNSHSFLSIITSNNLSESIKSFFSVEPNPYWKNHYQFDKPTEKQSSKKIGASSLNLLLVNFIAPCLYTFKQYHSTDFEIDEIFSIFDTVKEENNRIVTLFKKENIPLKGAIDSQSLTHLYKNYCTQKKCIKCLIGTEILQKKWNFLNQ